MAPFSSKACATSTMMVTTIDDAPKQQRMSIDELCAEIDLVLDILGAGDVMNTDDTTSDRAQTTVSMSSTTRSSTSREEDSEE